MIASIIMFVLYLLAYGAGLALYFTDYITACRLNGMFTLFSVVFVIVLFSVMSSAYATACDANK